MDYKKYQQFRLKEHVGYRPDFDPDKIYSVEGISIRESDLDRHDPLFAGQIGVVEAVVPADVSGAGNDEEEHVVLAFTHHQFMAHGPDESSPEFERQDDRERRVSFTQSQMDELFEPVEYSLDNVVASLVGADTPGTESAERLAAEAAAAPPAPPVEVTA